MAVINFPLQKFVHVDPPDKPFDDRDRAMLDSYLDAMRDGFDALNEQLFGSLYLMPIGITVRVGDISILQGQSIALADKRKDHRMGFGVVTEITSGRARVAFAGTHIVNCSSEFIDLTDQHIIYVGEGGTGSLSETPPVDPSDAPDDPYAIIPFARPVRRVAPYKYLSVVQPAVGRMRVEEP